MGWKGEAAHAAEARGAATGNERIAQCPLCGTRFRPAESRACSGCPRLFRGCDMAACPRCFHEFPVLS